MNALSTSLRGNAFLRPDAQILAALTSVVLLFGLVLHVKGHNPGNLAMPALAVIGALIGLVLVRSDFGFAGTFRAIAESGNLHGLKAHAVLLALTTLMFLPLLFAGQAFGLKVYGPATAIGPSFMLGALLFGIGMQIGGWCASGTLFSLGGGNLRLAGTLVGFVLGSTIGASQMDFWWSLPAIEPIVLQAALGFWPALIGQLGLLAMMFWLAHRFGRPAAGHVVAKDTAQLERLLTGRWPVIWGAVGLALLNVATLLLSSRPWGETAAFVLWGAKIGDAAGLTDASFWLYWQRQNIEGQLEASIFTDVTSIMDIAIIGGAMFGAATAGLFSFRLGGGLRAWTAAIIGGLLMGYGARLSNGCNISAYVASIASGNAAGWLWFLVAIAGSWVGVRLKAIRLPQAKKSLSSSSR